MNGVIKNTLGLKVKNNELPIKEALEIAYEQGKEDLKADIKKASVVMDGEKTYGSNMKIILLAEEKYNEILANNNLRSKNARKNN